MVVGDDDQSIYAWRGADVRNILDFEEHFPGARVVKLEHNYRSVQAVLDVANAVLARGSGRRHGKTLIATRSSEHRVQVVVCADPDVEASYVGAEIQRLLEREAVRPKEIAVLYRSNLQSAPIESALKERAVPIRMIGGQQFYERKEVKDLIAYLRVVLNPGDEMSLRRIVNYPARGVGDVALERISAYATAHDASLWSVVCKPHAVRDLPPAAMEGCRALVRLVEAMRHRLDTFSPASVARALVGEIGLKEDITAGATTNQAAARRWGNVEGILGVFFRREEQGKGGREQFAEFLRLIALRQDGEEEDATDRVTLTTVHGAKGLEWRHVFLVGLEEGLMPHARTLDERATDATPDGDAAVSLEEERRLFYVAVTRARDRLYLSRAKVRGQRGKLLPRTPSRFLLDVPPELYDEREEESAVAPELEKAKAGAAGVLAAILGEGGGTGEVAFIPRPGGPPRRRAR